PHKCRAYFSGSVSACVKNKAAIQDAELRNAENVLANEVIQTYKKTGIVMHPVELSQGVLKALEDPGIEARWGGGDQVFDLPPERIMLEQRGQRDTNHAALRCRPLPPALWPA